MNGEQSAYPSHGSMGEVAHPGLTKRELFAAMAMQGLCSCNHPQLVAWSPEELAVNAREQADALLAELAKDGAP